MPQVALYIVAVLHVGFFVLESLLWTHPTVRGIFQNSEEVAETTRVLAFNQGFYNLGLAVLLLVLQFQPNPGGVKALLAFIVVMGIVGGVSASRSILLLQSLPAAIALGLIWNAA
jgi:putative membrane protein